MGSGWVAQKQSIDDGYGEVDSCPACEDSPLWRVLGRQPRIPELRATMDALVPERYKK
jgi:hypothetical protein